MRLAGRVERNLQTRRCPTPFRTTRGAVAPSEPRYELAPIAQVPAPTGMVQAETGPPATTTGGGAPKSAALAATFLTSPLPRPYTNWGAAEPSGAAQPQQDCVAAQTNGQWRDDDCFNVDYNYVCERP